MLQTGTFTADLTKTSVWHSGDSVWRSLYGCVQCLATASLSCHILYLDNVTSPDYVAEASNCQISDRVT